MMTLVTTPSCSRYQAWFAPVLLVVLLWTTPLQAWNETAPSLRLPRLQLQLVCGHDIRDAFHNSSLWQDFYQPRLPVLVSGVNEWDDLTTRFHYDNLQMNSMSDIPPQKWYFPACNMSSPQVVITLELEGWVQPIDGTLPLSMIQDNANGTSGDDMKAWKQSFDESITTSVLREYFATQICPNPTAGAEAYENPPGKESSTDLTFFRAFFHDWSSSNVSSGDGGIEMSQNLFLLCGGEDFLYYDEDERDSGFVLLGLIVGLIMVGMICTELQQFENRPQSSRSRRQRDYEPTETVELEMV